MNPNAPSVPRRSVFAALSYCERCKTETRFVRIQLACALTSVSRRTIYNWMEQHWIHWRELPSGHRVICENCLIRAPEPADDAVEIAPPDSFSAKACNRAQPRKLTRR